MRTKEQEVVGADVSNPWTVRQPSREEFNEMLSGAPDPTDDDVSITSDGRRLDSKEAVIAFFAELDAEAAAAAE